MADILRQGSNGIGLRLNVADRLRSGRGATNGCSSRECHGTPGIEIHDPAELPFVHNLLNPSWSFAKEGMIRANGQFVCTVAGDLVRPIETQQCFFDRPASGITICRARIRVAITHGFAPRPRRRVRKALGKTPGELYLHRVIRRIPEVIQHQDWSKLWIRDDIVLGEAGTAKNLAGRSYARSRCQSAQTVYKGAGAAVGELSAQGRIGANRHGTGPCRTVASLRADVLRAGSLQVNALQHLVQQRRVTTSPRGVKSVEQVDVAVKGVNLVQVDIAPEFGSLRSEVSDFDCCVGSNLPLNFEIPV